VQPSLQAVASAYQPLLRRLPRWERAYCPVCGARGEPLDGSAPDSAVQRRCPRCATAWVAAAHGARRQRRGLEVPPRAGRARAGRGARSAAGAGLRWRWRSSRSSRPGCRPRS
jgi:hypothetical protein